MADDKREHESDHASEPESGRKDDTIRRTMVDNMTSAATEVPDILRRLSVAAEGVKKEGRLLRMETRRVRTSRPGMLRPEIKTGGSTK